MRTPSLPRSVAAVARRGRVSWLVALSIGIALFIVLLLLVVQEGSEEGSGPGEVRPEDQLAREQAAALYHEATTVSLGISEPLMREAGAALEPLIDRARPSTADLVGAAVVAVELDERERATELLERARERAPEDAAVHFVLGKLAQDDLDRQEDALAHFQLALASDPDDLPTRIAMAMVLENLDREDEALEQYEAVREVGADFGGSWYVAAIYRLKSIYQLRDRIDLARELLEEHSRLTERGVTSPNEIDLRRGNLGRLERPDPAGIAIAPLGPAPELAEPEVVLPDLAGAEGLAAHDLDGDGRLDLLARGPAGVRLGLQAADGGWTTVVLRREPVELALALDLGQDDDLDVLVSRGGRLALHEAVRAVEDGPVDWRPWKGAVADLPGAVADALAVDVDHEGDLDLVLVGEFGVRLLRNDGAEEPDAGGSFHDATAESGLPTDGAFSWCLAEDLDGDQDVDLLLGGAESVLLADNLRGGRFADASERIGGDLASELRPLVADLDGDGRPDLWSARRGDDGRIRATLFRGQPSAKLRADESYVLELSASALRGLHAADLDLDGALDVLWSAPGAALEGRRALGLDEEAEIRVGEGLGSERAAVVIADLDGDLAFDLARVGEGGVEVLRGTPGTNGAVLLDLRGRKDNRRGVGAMVELGAGGVYRRVFWPGEQQLLGVGGAGEVDWLRVLWPNGVVQYDLRTELGDRRATPDEPLGLQQSEGLVGSCPFLYTWNGTTYEFISDVLGITPLGLPMAPGMLVPPDHDEYVLVRGEQLVPRDGFLELQFTEELREVTYLDRIRLEAVDHPVGTEIYPNELFSFPPFPEPHTHTVRSPLAPASAVDGAGRDWSAALAEIDDTCAVPFEALSGQFLGLATPHVLELAFDPARVADARRLRLVMTGWFYWTDASVNMAAAHHPTREFVPPLLQVPDGSGGWRDTGPPIGFPAGKTKTMVVDVTDLLDRSDPRLRLFSTLRLYWDSIRLAVDEDDAELVVRSLEPTGARLWERGFSAPQISDLPDRPERFEWDRLSERPRWNQHPGDYTRFGEVLPLLGTIDDCFVVMGSGDCLTVRFDGRDLPPPAPGMRRDWLVFLDGWAKDRDPNTHEALYVEPLPFHGMSGYPYGPDERYPDDAEHRAFRTEWNTRPARRWIDALAPRAGSTAAERASPSPE